MLVSYEERQKKGLLKKKANFQSLVIQINYWAQKPKITTRNVSNKEKPYFYTLLIHVCVAQSSLMENLGNSVLVN